MAEIPREHWTSTLSLWISGRVWNWIPYKLESFLNHFIDFKMESWKVVTKTWPCFHLPDEIFMETTRAFQLFVALNNTFNSLQLLKHWTSKLYPKVSKSSQKILFQSNKKPKSNTLSHVVVWCSKCTFIKFSHSLLKNAKIRV